MRHLPAAVLILFLLSTIGEADQWPQFRGTTGAGVSNETNLPSEWSDSQGIQWAMKLSGRGNSSPVVTTNRVDITTQEEDGSVCVVSIDRKMGRVLRKTKIGPGELAANGPKNLYAHRHNAATPTAIADETSIWAFFGSGQLVCLQAATGKIQWQHDMPKEYGAYDVSFGMGSSPRLWKDHLYIACMTKGASYVVAFDKRTGKEVWKTTRRLSAKDDGPDAYSTPTILNHAGGSALLVSGSDHVNAYDLESGAELWVAGGLGIESPYGRIIASPIESQGVVVAISANPAGGGLGHVLAIPSNKSGRISASEQIWKFAKSTPDSSTPVCVDGNLFMVTDAGIATCLALKTGQVYWQKRLSKGPYHASVVAGDGKVYFLSIDGVCSVLKASTKFEIVAVNKLSGTFYATPAISDGVIYLRAYERLFAIK